MNRRRFLRVTATAGVAGIPGCNLSNDTDAPHSSPQPSPTRTPVTQTEDDTAAVELSIQQAETETETITVGERIEVRVQVTNTGEQAGKKALRLETESGVELATEQVRVPAGETVSTTLTTGPAPEPDAVRLLLNGQQIGTVTIERPQSMFYVGPGGSDSNPGTEAEPFETIQHAVGTVDPGGTVHVLPGEYHQFIGIDGGNAGEAGNPITLTGPPDAVIKPGGDHLMHISGSHFHLTGLTLDGLLDEANPDDPASYIEPQLIGISPTDPDPHAPHYIENLVISPHGMGNTQSALINAALLKDSEIGGFKVTGIAGAEWILGDTHGHNGEFVYLGTAIGNLEKNQGIEVYDETRNIRVHHIDNSAGHPHSEIVDCKSATRNITVEYCTDGGGARSKDSYYQPAISLDGREHTIRWNIIQDAFGDGIRIGPQAFLSNQEYLAEPETEFERQLGKDHAIYGNVFTGCKHEAVNFLRESARPGRDSNPLPEDQRALCGNLYDGYTDAEPGKACPVDVPVGDGVGHLGGDSPWQGSPPLKEEVFGRNETAPHLDVTVHRDTVSAGTDIEIPVTVTNNADTADDVVVGLRERRYLLEETTVRVPAGSEREVTLTEGALSQSVELEVTRNGQKVGSVFNG